MENSKRNVLFAALGAASGMTGLAAITRCTGGGCPSCLGCVIPGLGIALLGLIGKRKGGKQNHGMAQDRR